MKSQKIFLTILLTIFCQKKVDISIWHRSIWKLSWSEFLKGCKTGRRQLSLFFIARKVCMRNNRIVLKQLGLANQILVFILTIFNLIFGRKMQLIVFSCMLRDLGLALWNALKPYSAKWLHPWSHKGTPTQNAYSIKCLRNAPAMIKVNVHEVICRLLSCDLLFLTGPALLFSKYDIQTGDEKRFYACSAFRDRKQCSFFQWETSQTSAEKASEDHTLKQRSQFTHKQFRKRWWISHGPRSEKTCLWNFRQVETQTSLISYRDKLENWNFPCSRVERWYFPKSK